MENIGLHTSNLLSSPHAGQHSALVNYFPTPLAGEDKCFDLAVSGILFLSYSWIELGSMCFECCHPGLTLVLGTRMLGGRSRSPKAQPSGNPRTPRAGAALWPQGSSDLCMKTATLHTLVGSCEE